MKPIYLLLIAVMASLCTNAQSSTPKSSTFNQTIQHVLSDIPHNLRTVTGELLFSEAGTEYYESTVRMPGAERSTVLKYNSIEDSTASWNAKMFASDDFKKAAAQYKTLYKQLKATQLRLVDGSIIFVSGEFDTPAEEKDILMSTLRLNTGDKRYKDVKMDLEMIYQFPEWIININIGSKKKDSLEDYAYPAGM